MPPAAHMGFCRAWSPGRPSPDQQTIQIVAVELDRIIPQPELLDDEERGYGARLRLAIHRQYYLAAHTVLRLALGSWLGLDPAYLHIKRTSHGKPYLANQTVGFNLSHSGAQALIGLTHHGEIGIDLEHLGNLGSVDSLQERILTPIEQLAWLKLPPHDRPFALLQAWTRKEAVLKAIGVGLPGGMEHVILGQDPLQLLGDHLVLPAMAAIQLCDLPVDGGHAAALAANLPVSTITLMRWITN